MKTFSEWLMMQGTAYMSTPVMQGPGAYEYAHADYDLWVANQLLKSEKEENMILDGRPGFKFGCDPELFVKNDKGVFVSAEGLIPGTKAQPHPVKCGAVQVDGMAAEFNIDPATSFEEFNNNIKTVLKELAAFLPAGYTLEAVPSVTFSQDEWEKSPDSAKELGCTPDFNAWTGEINPPPVDPDNPMLRTASGHIHIGWTEDMPLSDLQHVMNCRDLVKQLDWYLGGWSTKIDKDPTRRRLYGKAGACRFKTYGVEYRVLSNFWVTSSDRRLNVWNRLQLAIDDMRTIIIADRSEENNSRLVEQINESVWDSSLVRQHRYPLVTTDRSYARL